MIRKIAFLTGIFLMLAPSAATSQEPPKFFDALVKVQSTVPESARTAKSLGTEREGSGVVIDNKGHILTIGYLILEADSISVVGSDGKLVSAVFVGYDHRSGFGLVRTVVPMKVQPIEMGRSAAVTEGELIMVASHQGASTARGARVISRKEFAGYWEYLLDDAIFTSPPFADYGGAALIDSKGELLGIGSLFTQLSMPGVGMIPCNMFVPIDLLKPILNDLIATGRSAQPPQPWLGLHADENYGRVFVIRVTAGSPAAEVGMKSGDIVLTVGGKAVAGLADFYRKVWASGNAGVDITLSVLQGTKIKDVVIRSADRHQYLDLQPKVRGIRFRHQPAEDRYSTSL